MLKKKKTLPQRFIQGMGISPGLAYGRAFIYTDILLRDHELYDVKPSDSIDEFCRIEQAIADVKTELVLSAERIERELNSQIAGIFLSQVEILKDPQLLRDLRGELDSNLVNAEQIVKIVLRRWELRFRQVQDELISYRADDIIDLNRRILRALTGIQAHTLERLPSGSIIVARRLLPSDTVFLSRNSAKGIITEFGGPTSHAALLTREIGIPSIGKVMNVLEVVHPGDQLLVNGEDGHLIINPDDHTHKKFVCQMRYRVSRSLLACKQSKEQAVKKDGSKVEVMANVSSRKDVEAAIKNGADGIGLFRIENIYLSRNLPPTMNELTREIEHAIQPAGDKPVTIRLLDLGGDKRLTYLNVAGFDDSFLGRRGIRFMLEYPELLYTQINALINLSGQFNIRVLVPMVTLSKEIELVREILSELQGCAVNKGNIALGVMIETPASALCVEDFLPFVDFLSIGTNDLTQYVMAAGRENHTVVNYFIEDHPAVFKLMKMVVQNAGNKPVSICGELAANKAALGQIFDSGICSISVAPSFIPEIKQQIRGM